MKTSIVSALAGAVFLASGAIAGAGEPVKLGSAELDAVTAGQPSYDRTAIASISQAISQRNYTRVDVDQDARAESYSGNATAYNTSAVNVTQSNTATQWNYGNASADASGNN